MIKVGLIGLGYWGPNHARVLNQTPKCEFSACCDLDSRRLEKIQRQYPSLKAFRRTEDLLNSDVDAVVIATPISTHYELARQALHAASTCLSKSLSRTPVPGPKHWLTWPRSPDEG